MRDSGLDFTAQALRKSVSNLSEELSTSFSKAYEGSLKQYHNFVVKGAFAVSDVHPAVLSKYDANASMPCSSL